MKTARLVLYLCCIDSFMFDVNGVKDMTALKLEISGKQQLIKIRLS